MKSDEIRKRAKEIANVQLREDAEDQILKLAEDILGKPLGPEFDESLVKHGSVWESRGEKVVIHRSLCRQEYTATLLNDSRGSDSAGEYFIKGDFVRGTKESISDMLIKWGYTYLGQFDFSWPQKHPMFDEAVELLRKWNEWWHDGTKNSVIHPTTIFLAKLGGK